MKSNFAELNTPQLILAIAYLLLFAFVVWKAKWFSLKFLPKQVVVFAFVIKAFAAFALTWLYTNYYTDKQNSDIYKYFEDGLVLYNILFYSPKMFFQLLFEVNTNNAAFSDVVQNFNHWFPQARSMVYNDSRFIIKLNAVFSFVSLQSIYIHSLFGAFIGFVGIVAFAKVGEVLFPKLRNAALLLLFFPSIIFWTSAMLKETLLVFVFGIFAWYIVQLSSHFNWKRVVVCFILFFVLALLKVYVLLCLIPPLIAFFVVRNQQSKLITFGVFTVVVIAVSTFAFVADAVLLHSTIANGIAQKQFNMVSLAVYMKAGSLIYIPDVDGSNLLTFIPAGLYGIFNVLLKPFIWETTSPLFLASALENLVLVFLIVSFVFQIKTLENKEWNLSLVCIFFALLMFALIGITTPVIGSIVRYRVPALVLLLLPLSAGINYLKIFSTPAGSKE